MNLGVVKKASGKYSTQPRPDGWHAGIIHSHGLLEWFQAPIDQSEYRATSTESTKPLHPVAHDNPPQAKMVDDGEIDLMRQRSWDIT
jgi:hypothetical protein